MLSKGEKLEYDLPKYLEETFYKNVEYAIDDMGYGNKVIFSKNFTIL